MLQIQRLLRFQKNEMGETSNHLNRCGTTYLSLQVINLTVSETIIATYVDKLQVGLSVRVVGRGGGTSLLEGYQTFQKRDLVISRS